MKNIGKKLILISFFLALISTIAVVTYLQSFKNKKQATDTISIIVANENIPARTIIQKKMTQQIQVPNNSIFKDYIRDSSKIIGKYSKNTILKNEGFRDENFLNKNGNEISANIDSNHRAISINVTGASAVSDLLKVGDCVDIIGTFPEKKELDVTVRPDTSKIIMENIQVLAIDKQISRQDNPKDANEKIPTTYLITLSVPVLDIEKLVLTEDVGNIKLALRPLANEGNVETKGAKWQDVLAEVTTNSPELIKENFVMYTVKNGDTLRTISLEYYKDTEKFNLIKEANNIQNENQIITGEVLKIPLNH